MRSKTKRTVELELVEADFYLPVTLEARGHAEDQREVEAGSKLPLLLENLPCKIYLPRQRSGKVRLQLFFNRQQADELGVMGAYFWRSALFGELPYGDIPPDTSEEQAASGTTSTTPQEVRRAKRRKPVHGKKHPLWRGVKVRARTVYIDQGPSVRSNVAFQEITATLEPGDLEIEEVLWPGVKPKRFASGHFWLTPNRFLDGLSTRPRHDIYLYIGSGRKPFRFTLPLPLDEGTGHITKKATARSSPILSLEQQITHYHNEDGNEVLVREQIMPFRLSMRDRRLYGVDDRLSDAVDDWILLASVGSRWPTACLGWELFDSQSITRHFRCDRIRPRADDLRWPKQDAHYGLVDVNDFEEFLRHSYNFLHELEEEDREVLRQVLERILKGYGRAVESSFLALYAALEMLVLRFRKAQGLETIFTTDEWKVFEKDATQFVKHHPLTSSDKKRRQLLYEKGGELNRISFGTAFRAFCAAPEHSVVGNDLWPITGPRSLSLLRNELVHGETFSPMRQGALGTASFHLLWWLERMVLSLMNWPQDRSMVAPRFLRELTTYMDWKEDQRILFDSVQDPE